MDLHCFVGWELESWQDRCTDLTWYKVGGVTPKPEQANSDPSLGLVGLSKLKVEMLSGAGQS